MRLALVGLGLVLACATALPRSDLEAWGRGPVRWLLLPDEARRLELVRGPEQAERFVAAFWRRRDPALAAAFAARVDAADRLYGDGGTRGSLTDRGRALVLLGPPPRLRTAYRPMPSFRPARTRSPAQRPMLRVEIWLYALEELPTALREALDSDEVAVSFALEPDRARLLDGEELLERVRRAYVVAPWKE